MDQEILDLEILKSKFENEIVLNKIYISDINKLLNNYNKYNKTKIYINILKHASGFILLMYLLHNLCN